MASRALRAFLKNMVDVRDLIEIAAISHEVRGHPVLNKTGIVLTCSYWEAYCEDVAADGLENMVQHSVDFTALPVKLRRDLATHLRNDKNDLAVWSLAGDGWRDALRQRLASFSAARNYSFNTPKPDQIDALFENTLGISSLSDCWTIYLPSRTAGGSLPAPEARAMLSEFVTVRGAIAHRGTTKSPLELTHVKNYADLIEGLAQKTDQHVEHAVRSATGFPM